MSKKEKQINGGCYMMMPPKKLRAHPMNEKYFGQNNSRYDELFESIRANGFEPQYPVTCVREGNNSFVIICGHRRWRIACEQNISEVPINLRQDILVNSANAERIMIEDNLHRPLQWRAFSELERYMLSLQLDVLYEKRRGGDRKSEKFLESNKEGCSKQKNRHEQIASLVGMSPRYLSMLSVVTKGILKELAEASPDMFEGCSTYDQIKIALDNNLSSELSALSRSEIPVYRAYKKFKKANQGQSPLSEGSIPSLEIEGDRGDVLFKDVVNSFIRYFESQFDDGKVFSEAAAILSETPKGSAKQLKLLNRALNSVMQKMQQMNKNPEKKGIVELQLFSGD